MSQKSASVDTAPSAHNLCLRDNHLPSARYVDFKIPVDPGVKDRGLACHGHPAGITYPMGYGGSVGGGANVGAGFDEQDVEGPILGHPTGHNAARRAGADDNVSELVVHGTNAISDALVFFFVSSLL
jgi:hypothetical protein